MEKDELLGELMEFVAGNGLFNHFLDTMEENGYVKEEVELEWDNILDDL